MSSPTAQGYKFDFAHLVVVALPAAWVAHEGLTGGQFGLLGNVIFLTHEGGHLVFGFLGRFVAIAGGTLMQLLMPAAFVAHFFLRGQRLSAAITCFWLSASFANAAHYARDAVHQELPLIHTGLSAREELEQFGETEHDWINMLEMVHLPLGAAHGFAGLLSLTAFVIWAAGLAWGLHIAGLRIGRRAGT